MILCMQMAVGPTYICERGNNKQRTNRFSVLSMHSSSNMHNKRRPLLEEKPKSHAAADATCRCHGREEKEDDNNYGTATETRNMTKMSTVIFNKV